MEEEFKVTNEILATSGQRLANLFIDRLLFYGVFFAFGFIAVLIGELTNNDAILNYIVGLENVNRITDMIITGLIFSIFYLIFESTTQKTLGKYITQTKVVLENGEKPDVNTIAIRSICRIIPFDPLSYLGKPPRGWHDTISKTYVVDIKKFNTKKESFSDFEQLGKDENEVIF